MESMKSIECPPSELPIVDRGVDRVMVIDSD